MSETEKDRNSKIILECRASRSKSQNNNGPGAGMAALRFVRLGRNMLRQFWLCLKDSKSLSLFGKARGLKLKSI